MANDAAIKRFSALIRQQPDGCWLWTSSVRPNKYITYGMFWFEGKSTGAHRASWQLFRGTIPSGMCVLHKCDVPLCVNPDHLFLGTYLDNARDMQKKGRQGYAKSTVRGEIHYRAKLSSVDVLAIRADTRNHRLIAGDYHLDPSTISQIKSFKRWKHI